MSDFLYLVPLALVLGLIGLVAFMWSLRSGQYDDLDGAAERILFEEEGDLIEPEPQNLSPSSPGLTRGSAGD